MNLQKFLKRTLLLAGALLLLATVAATPARAADKDEGWQPVTTQMVQPGESFQAKDLVAVAYGFIWVMVAGFVFSVWRRADKLEKEIAVLRDEVRRRGNAQVR